MCRWKQCASSLFFCTALPLLLAAQDAKPNTNPDSEQRAKPDPKQDPDTKQNSNDDRTLPSAPKVVDGREHPELIPDATAYRMVFTHLSEHAGDPEREKVWFGVPGLSADDQEMLLRIMTEYKKEWDEIVKTYNDAAEAASRDHGKPPEPSVLETFRTKTAELVRQTRRDLTASLSPAGALLFHNYVQEQKHSMVVTLEPEEEKENPQR